MKKIYSPAPREAYSNEYEGRQYGVGLHPVYDVVPGAWGITWLLAAPFMEELLNYRGPAEEYPTYLPGALPHAVGTALQRCGEGLRTWGDMAEDVAPTELLRRMRMAIGPFVPIVVKFYGEIILDVMAENAELYHSHQAKNVVYINTWKAKVN